MALPKYKALLDAGVITEEEFAAEEKRAAGTVNRGYDQEKRMKKILQKNGLLAATVLLLWISRDEC